MVKILICIDDTDNLESIGTGQLLENLCGELKREGLGESGFVTRHQLFIHEDIPYTSHNSSMCCEVTSSDLEKTIAVARKYLSEHAAEGSDPGLCVLDLDASADYSSLMEFGRKAQTEILKKEAAYSVAASYNGSVFLSEHGGSGEGIIGALAGIGLRLTGSDGRIKGKLFPIDGHDEVTVHEICLQHGVEQILDNNDAPLPMDTMVRFTEPAKAILLDNKVTLKTRTENGIFYILAHRGRKK